jgi:hypothetical protein
MVAIPEEWRALHQRATNVTPADTLPQ